MGCYGSLRFDGTAYIKNIVDLIYGVCVWNIVLEYEMYNHSCLLDYRYRNKFRIM